LVAMEQDQGGRYSTWLVVHRWSTVDPRFAGASAAASGQLRIIADDRELRLTPINPQPPMLGQRRALLAPPDRHASSAACSVDADMLHSIASAHGLSLR